MNDCHDQKEKPRGTLVGLCQRIAELEAAEVEREQTEEALRESERKYRDLVDNSIVGIYRTNSAGKILYVNEALARMLEFDSPEEMMSEGVLARYKNNKDREHLLEILKKSGRVDNFEFDLLTRKGETVTALLSAVLDQDIISGMIMDISERKRIEKALRESEQRYRSLFKNNHSVILLVDPESGDIVDANTAACSFYGWSLEELTSMKITDINMLPNEQIFQEIERAKSEARNHFLFQHRLANEITIINGDPNQIEQALLALAVNTRDAMPSGGKIIIKTKRMILDDDFLRTHAGAAMGECALITVSDTGPGLGQKTLEHVFDPFYSKDDSSEKTGLGLSMVYGIVKNHGGYVSCSSEPEVGTTFMIYLPASEKDA